MVGHFGKIVFTALSPLPPAARSMNCAPVRPVTGSQPVIHSEPWAGGKWPSWVMKDTLSQLIQVSAIFSFSSRWMLLLTSFTRLPLEERAPSGLSACLCWW